MAAFCAQELASLIELRDGVMFWKPRGRRSFDDFHAGNPVSLRPSGGYQVIRIRQRDIFAHRAIWALHYGAWPAGTIDHINGNKTDNRIENLRDCSIAVNNRNRFRLATNTSGRAGVVRSGDKWRAQIVAHGAYRHLGTFDSFDDAVAARIAAQCEHGFTIRHGSAGELTGRETRGGCRAESAAGQLKRIMLAQHDKAFL